jgi:Domain of unknown function (DUF4281)
MACRYVLLTLSGRIPRLHRALTSHVVPFLLCLAWIAAVCVAAAVTSSTFPQVIEESVATLNGGVMRMAGQFGKRWFTCLCWMHLLMLDFLLAREIALDAFQLRVFAAHSLLLCFMCGPIGYLSHQATKAAYAFARRKRSEAVVVPA